MHSSTHFFVFHCVFALSKKVASFRFEDEGKDENEDQVHTFAHCAHAQIPDSDGVTMLLQSTSSFRPS